MPSASHSAHDVTRPVHHLLDILDAVEDSVPGISLESIVAATGLPADAAHLYLETLESRGYIEREAVTGVYRLHWGGRQRDVDGALPRVDDMYSRHRAADFGAPPNCP